MPRCKPTKGDRTQTRGSVFQSQAKGLCAIRSRCHLVIKQLTVANHPTSLIPLTLAFFPSPRNHRRHHSAPAIKLPDQTDSIRQTEYTQHVVWTSRPKGDNERAQTQASARAQSPSARRACQAAGSGQYLRDEVSFVERSSRWRSGESARARVERRHLMRASVYGELSAQ